MELALSMTRAGQVDWESAYHDYGRELLAYLLRLVHDTESASDLLQDTFVAALRARNDPRDPNKVRPWLYRIATNAAYRHLRRARLLRLVPFSEAAKLEVAGADAADRHLHAALASLNAEQAAALLLQHQQGFTRREIAEITGVSEEAVKSRLARGRANFIAAYRRLERGLAR